MSDFLRVISALQQHMNATFSRSDILRPLHIVLGSVILLVLGLSYVGSKAPEWAFVYSFIALGVTLGLELIAYIFCLFFDRDALRSEKYHLQKMAIEAKILGDANSGLFELGDKPQIPSSRGKAQLIGSAKAKMATPAHSSEERDDQ